MSFTSRIVTRDELPNPKLLRGRIRLDGVLPNDAYISGVPKNIFSGGGTGNVGTGLDLLFGFTFPAGTFRQNNENFRAVIMGSFGANDDNKRLAVGFDTSTLMDTGLIDIDGNGWAIWVDGKRDDATHASIQCTTVIGNIAIDSGGGISSAGMKAASFNFNFGAVNNFDTTNIDLIVSGESATATNNNVFCSLAIIDLVRF